MKKKYEKISAKILIFTRDAVSTSGRTEGMVSRNSMADVDDVYDYGWMSEVK